MVVDGAACNAAAQALEIKGFATLELPQEISDIVSHAFGVAQPAFDCLEDGPPTLGPHTKDSANASGSHRIGALSTYNACREGFVFSNGATFSVRGVHGFEATMGSFFAAAADTAQAVLAAIERRLQLPQNWFDSSLGPVRDHAQWHLKRYRQEAAPKHAVTSDGKLVLLAVHSDPSLISLVFHDAPGRSPGALGLECQVDGRRGATKAAPASASLAKASGVASAAAEPEVSGGPSTLWEPVTAHGHAVVTILVGSVLDRLTCGRYRAVRHRVAVPSGSPLETARRVAATFFFRPAPSALLQPPPSPMLQPPSGGMPRPIKFSAWQQKVADKYERHKPPTNFLAATDTVVPQLRVRVRARGEESAATTSALDVRILWRM